MSIEQLDRIDFISTTPEGKINLTVSDHLDWNEEEAHSQLLQDKIFVYLEFIESGQLVENYPDSINKDLIISVNFKFSPSEKGLADLEKMKIFFEDKNIEFNWL